MTQVPNRPNDQWYQKRNHVKIPQLAERTATLDTTFTQPGGAIPPANTALPVVTGFPVNGETLHSTDGVWTGYPVPVLSYNWQRNGVTIVPQTNLPDYTVVPADIGAVLRCRVCATNTPGVFVCVNSAATAVVVDHVIPVNTTPPVISGLAEAGRYLHITPGTWSGVPAPTLSHIWRVDGVNAQHNSNDFLLTEAMIGKMITCQERAENSAGGRNWLTNALGPVAYAAQTFVENWSEFEVGNTWPQVSAIYTRSSAAATLTVVDNVGAPLAKSIDLNTGGGIQWIHRSDVSSYMGKRTVEPVEILARLSGRFTSAAPRVGAGYFSSATEFTGAVFRFVTSNNNRVSMLIRSPLTDTVSEVQLLGGLANNAVVNVRMQIDGDTIRGRAWLNGNTEPATWVSATDTAPIEIKRIDLAGSASNPNCVHLGYSVGISTAAPSLGDGANATINIISDGVLRTFRLRTPENPQPNAPLIIAFHGGHGHAAAFQNGIGLDDRANPLGFYTIYPSSLGPNWTDGRIATEGGANDLLFVQDMVGYISTKYAVNPTKVFGTGMSNGGMLCHWAVAELPNLFAGIAPVAANIPQTYFNSARSPCAVLMFNGTRDNFMPYEGGQGNAVTDPTDLMTSSQSSIARYAENNNAGGYTDTLMPDIDPPDGTSVSRREYANGMPMPTVLYSIFEGGHTWPGGEGDGSGHPVSGLTTGVIIASQIISDTFAMVAATR